MMINKVASGNWAGTGGFSAQSPNAPVPKRLCSNYYLFCKKRKVWLSFNLSVRTEKFAVIILFWL